MLQCARGAPGLHWHSRHTEPQERAGCSYGLSRAAAREHPTGHMPRKRGRERETNPVFTSCSISSCIAGSGGPAQVAGHLPAPAALAQGLLEQWWPCQSLAVREVSALGCAGGPGLIREVLLPECARGSCRTTRALVQEAPAQPVRRRDQCQQHPALGSQNGWKPTVIRQPAALGAHGLALWCQPG